MAEFKLTYHPDYVANLKRWLMLWDFARGGEHVLMPKGAQDVFFWDRSGGTDDGGTDPDRSSTKKTTYRWTPHPKNSYLLSHERESQERYDDRQTRAAHIPVCKPVLDIYTSGVLRAGPKRGKKDEELGEIWRDYYSNVDMAGTNIDPFMRDAFWKALICGRVHAITDRPKASEGTLSRQDELDIGVRAYTYLVTVFNLLDWALDANGNFLWVEIKEDLPDLRMPGQEREKKQADYHAVRVWNTREWKLFWPEFDPDNRKWAGATDTLYLQDEGVHGLGEVPIATLFAKRVDRRTLDAEPLITSLVDIDRNIYNKQSLLDEIDFGQTFAQLAIPDSGSLNIHEIRMGIYEAFTFDPEGGSPLYLSPNPDTAAGLWVRIVELFHTARVVAGVSRGRAEFSKEERSAAAIGHESEEKHDQMTGHAESVQEFEETMHRHFSMWEDIEHDVVPSLEYNRRFNVEALSSRLGEALSIKNLDPGPVAMAAVKKSVVAEYLKKAGIGENDIATAIKDIEAHTELMQDALETHGDQKPTEEE